MAADPPINEPPIVIENRKTLTYLLCEAAELEHGLMCEYLYAAFSLKTEADETLPAEHLEAVERWRSVLLGVAAQEMLHWALVNNLLTAVGSAPYVARPHMPHQAKGYPRRGPARPRAVRRAGACATSSTWNGPKEWSCATPTDSNASGPALPIMAATDIVPWGQEFHTVGHLYRSIQAGIHNLSNKLGEDRLFIGPREAQANPESFGWPELVAITDAATASQAIDAIVEQGEGARGDWSAAHYGRFLAVFEEFQAIRASDPTFEPAHPVVAAGVRPVDGVGYDVIISDAVTAAVSDLFNVTYDLILQILVRFLANVGEDKEQLGILARTSVTLMFAVIKPLGLLLATLPVGPEHPGVTAGANFQLFYQKSFLLPHRRATWIRFTERLDEAAEFADSLSTRGAARRRARRGRSVAAQAGGAGRLADRLNAGNLLPVADLAEIDQAIAALEAQRGLLGDAVVDTAIEPLAAQRAELLGRRRRGAAQARDRAVRRSRRFHGAVAATRRRGCPDGDRRLFPALARAHRGQRWCRREVHRRRRDGGVRHASGRRVRSAPGRSGRRWRCGRRCRTSTPASRCPTTSRWR